MYVVHLIACYAGGVVLGSLGTRLLPMPRHRHRPRTRHAAGAARPNRLLPPLRGTFTEPGVPQVTSHLRYTCVCLLCTVALGAGSLRLATTHRPWPALVLLYGALFLAWAARSEWRAHHRLLAEDDRAGQHARGGWPPPLRPCRPLGQGPNGGGHDRRCTRDRLHERFERTVTGLEDEDAA